MSDATSHRAAAQDSLADQVWRVLKLANMAGEYDAADWIRRHWNRDALISVGVDPDAPVEDPDV